MPNTAPADNPLCRSILEHVLAAIGATPVQTHPFPHIVVRGFFPADVYQRLLENLPSADAYEAFSVGKHAGCDGRCNRKHFPLEGDRLTMLPGPQQECWHDVRSVLGSSALKETVYHKLRTSLWYRFGFEPDAARSVPGFARPELFRETSGYRIKPHTDTRKKVAALQVALVEDGSRQHLGTELYRRSTNPARLLREPRGFETVKTLPFLPNTAYAFVVLNTLRLKSWHGRSRLLPGSGVRNTILNTWYLNAEHANQEILKEHTSGEEPRRAA